MRAARPRWRSPDQGVAGRAARVCRHCDPACARAPRPGAQAQAQAQAQHPVPSGARHARGRRWQYWRPAGEHVPRDSTPRARSCLIWRDGETVCPHAAAWGACIPIRRRCTLHAVVRALAGDPRPGPAWCSAPGSHASHGAPTSGILLALRRACCVLCCGGCLRCPPFRARLLRAGPAAYPRRGMLSLDSALALMLTRSTRMRSYASMHHTSSIMCMMFVHARVQRTCSGHARWQPPPPHRMPPNTTPTFSRPVLVR